MDLQNSFFKLALNFKGKVLTGYKLKLEVQNEFLNKIRSTLPHHLACHALFCVISGKKILLYTDSSVWSSQLRFYTQAIIQELISSEQRNFEEIKIKIIPKVVEKERREVKLIPSTKHINLILNQAEIQTDEKLKMALSKLGKTLKKHSKSHLKEIR